MKNIFIYFTLVLVAIISAKGQQADTNSPEACDKEELFRYLTKPSSQAYESAALQLMMTEANYFVKQLKLPTPYPIQIDDVQIKRVYPLRGAMIPDTNSARLHDISIPREKRLKSFQYGVSGAFETTNFTFIFTTGRLSFIIIKESCVIESYKHPLQDKPSLINDAQAYQLATQWLAAIDIDVGALDKKYKYTISHQHFGKAELPIYYVSWGPTGYPPQIRVEILGTTKELREIIINDSQSSHGDGKKELDILVFPATR